MGGSIRRRDFGWRCALAILGGFAAITSARAESEFPTRTIKFVVPLAAGGAADVSPRIVAEKLSARWGQPVVIENRPGAGHTIGADAVAKAPPDGYTLLVTPPGPLVTSQLLYSKLSYDPTAFVPVSIVNTGHVVLVANPKIPASNLRELIAYAKAQPNPLRYASPGAGTTPHMAGEMLNALSGIQTTHVPYRGLAPAVTDLLAGHVDIMFDNLGNSLQYIRQGQLKALAAAGTSRIPELPDVAPVAEIYPGFNVASLLFAVVPPHTPQAIATRLSQAIADVVHQPDVKQRLEAISLIAVGSTPEEAREAIEREAVLWRKAIGATIVKVQSQ